MAQRTWYPSEGADQRFGQRPADDTRFVAVMLDAFRTCDEPATTAIALEAAVEVRTPSLTS